MISSGYCARPPKPRSTEARRGKEKEQGGQSILAKAGVGVGVEKRYSESSPSGIVPHVKWIQPPKQLFLPASHHSTVNNELWLRVTSCLLHSFPSFFPTATAFCTFSGLSKQPPRWSPSLQSYLPPNYPPQLLTECSQKHRSDNHFPS